MSKKAKGKMTRDDLLGFEKCFGLDQSEYIARKIIDQLFFLTFQQVRLHNVLELEAEYSAYFGMKTLQRAISFSIIESEPEYEKDINYNINFELIPARIDTWASNKAKILRNVPNEEPPVLPPQKPFLLNHLDSKDNIKADSLNLLKKAKNNIKPTESKAKKYVNREANIASDTLEPEQRGVELDEIEQAKLKGYRIFFQEKEIEKQNRKIQEKAQEERAKEEEKKFKQAMQIANSSALTSLDGDGRLLLLKPVNVSEMRDFLIPNTIIKDTKTIPDADQYITNAQMLIEKKPSGFEDVYKEEQPPIEIQQRFYQPNPLTSFNIPKGTIMDFYGTKKNGGNFDKGDGRLTHVDYMELLNQIHPYRFASMRNSAMKIPSSAANAKNDNAIPEESENNPNNAENAIPSFTKVYYMFRDVDDDINIQMKQSDKKLQDEQREILRSLSPKMTRQLLMEIKKKEKMKQVKKRKGFEMNDIPDVTSQKMYDDFKEEMDMPQLLTAVKTAKKVIPVNIHDTTQKLIGSMTKIPRQRRKDIENKTDYGNNWIKNEMKKKEFELEEKKKKEKEKEKNKLGDFEDEIRQKEEKEAKEKDKDKLPLLTPDNYNNKGNSNSNKAQTSREQSAIKPSPTLPLSTTKSNQKLLGKPS